MDALKSRLVAMVSEALDLQQDNQVGAYLNWLLPLEPEREPDAVATKIQAVYRGKSVRRLLQKDPEGPESEPAPESEPEPAQTLFVWCVPAYYPACEWTNNTDAGGGAVAAVASATTDA